LKNLDKEIKSSEQTFCSICKKRGGGIICSGIKCKKTYHYLCAKTNNCQMDNQKYKILCLSHQIKKNGRNLNENYCQNCYSSFDEDMFLKW
jgi:hypothetical protein